MFWILSHHTYGTVCPLIQKHSSASRLFVQVKHQTANALLFISQIMASTAGLSDLFYNHNNKYNKKYLNTMLEVRWSYFKRCKQRLLWFPKEAWLDPKMSWVTFADCKIAAQSVAKQEFCVLSL